MQSVVGARNVSTGIFLFRYAKRRTTTASASSLEEDILALLWSMNLQAVMAVMDPSSLMAD
ncbi:hypothetical protein E2C01_095148 [Portunus trituberculatus]|uniref:Uncharacterized protein n=1 Tax=Portunus trituberculatus TaxID=210409 RepID=A0A5B7K3G3_PORTR|nr:hypothetical protein [Portunus trituberculatus]